MSLRKPIRLRHSLFTMNTMITMRDKGSTQRRIGQAAHGAAREGAARGVGASASDRAGVWGGAPRENG